MVPLSSLVLPIVLSAVIVFILSAIVHMVLPYHRGDRKRLAREDDALEAVRRLSLAPGDYMAPHAGSPEGMRRPEFVEKMKRGPIVLMTVVSPGSVSMAKSLALWFVHVAIVSLFAGYIAGRALGPGADYREVFRFVGTTCGSRRSHARLHGPRGRSSNEWWPSTLGGEQRRCTRPRALRLRFQCRGSRTTTTASMPSPRTRATSG